MVLVGGLLPCPVDDRIWIELCVLNDRLESLDGLLEIFDVPVIVIGGTEEEAGLRGQELHCCLRVDKRTLVVNFSLKDLFATINEILDDIDRHLDRLAVINAVSSVVDEELVNRIGLAPVHEFFFVRLVALDVMVDDGVELTCLIEMLGKVRVPVGICLLTHCALNRFGNTVQVTALRQVHIKSHGCFSFV